MNSKQKKCEEALFAKMKAVIEADRAKEMAVALVRANNLLNHVMPGK